MELNKIENRKTIDKIHPSERTNKMDDPLANMAKIEREKTQITKIRMKRGTPLLKSQK